MKLTWKVIIDRMPAGELEDASQLVCWFGDKVEALAFILAELHQDESNLIQSATVIKGLEI